MKSKEHLIYIDSLRGLAALIVFLWHFAAVFYPAAISGVQSLDHAPWELLLFNLPLNVFFNGTSAVSLFFVLSGYILSKSFFDKDDAKVIERRFAARYIRLSLRDANSLLIVFFLLKDTWTKFI